MASKIKRTHEDFVKEIEQINPNIEIIDTFTTTKNKLNVKCKKCGLVWNVQAGSILYSKTGCPNCKGEKISKAKTKTHQQFQKEVVDKLPHIQILSKYDNRNTKIKCYCTIHKKYWTTTAARLLKTYGCPECSLEHIKQTKTITDKDFREIMSKNAPHIDIIDDYVDRYTKIQCHCNIHNYTWMATPVYLMNVKACPMESNSFFVITGTNDVATTHPQVLQYLKNPAEAQHYSHGSSHKVSCICPYCSYEKELSFNHLCTTGFKCDYCGDSISYPNKFGRAVIKQLPVNNVKYEYSPEWAGRMQYDIYFTYQNNQYLIEMDGAQHYRQDTLYSISNKNDIIKNQLAKDNNMFLLRIDCRYSDMEYIQKSILQSDLSKIFDLSMIDWNLCNKLASNTTLGEVCNYYNTVDTNLNHIAQYFNLSNDTIRKYLIRGVKMGICNYDYKPICINKKVDIFTCDNQFIITCNTVKDCEKYMKDVLQTNVNVHGIRNSCLGISNKHRGYIFKYHPYNDKNEIEEIIEEDEVIDNG